MCTYICMQTHEKVCASLYLQIEEKVCTLSRPGEISQATELENCIQRRKTKVGNLHRALFVKAGSVHIATEQ